MSTEEIENYFVESAGYGRDKVRNFMDIVNKALEQKGERIAELEAENAELKDDNKVMSDNYSKMEQKFYDNLTKAKEIIKDFLLVAKVEHLKDRYETVDEAEQFLNEVEK